MTEYHQALIAELVRVLRRKGYSIGTEQSYCHWMGRFFRFLESMQREHIDAEDVFAFLDYLALKRRVSASTQSLALNAMAFLFKTVLNQPLDEVAVFTRSKRPKRLPVVLIQGEVKQLLDGLTGVCADGWFNVWGRYASNGMCSLACSGR